MPKGKKILIIEDDTFLSSLIKARLERDGYLVIQAFDGEEGLQVVKKERPDAVILDLIMPKVSGFEVMEYLSMNVDFSQIPVIVLSNLAQDSDVQKAKLLGAKGFFVKIRISIDDLAAKMREVLGAGSAGASIDPK